MISIEFYISCTYSVRCNDTIEFYISVMEDVMTAILSTILLFWSVEM